MFPIRDLSGRITGFGGRSLDSDQQPKYLNSPQTEIFDKSSVLYGVHRGGDAIKAEGRAVLVEGYLDAVRAHASGFRNVVASLGTAVTVQQLLGLSRLTGTVVLALDPDPAGQAAAVRAGINALSTVTRQRGRGVGASGALDLRIARLPQETGDPDELIRDRPSDWKPLIDASVPAFEFLFTKTMQEVDRSSDAWRQEAIDRLMPAIQDMSESPGWQATWIERLATETGVDRRALQRSVPTQTGTRGRERSRTRDANTNVSPVTLLTAEMATDPTVRAEKALLTLLLKYVVLPADVSEAVLQVPWQRPEHKHLVDSLTAWRHSENYDVEMFLEQLSDDVRAIGLDLATRDMPLPAEGKFAIAVAAHLENLRKLRLKSQYTRASEIMVGLSGEELSAALNAVAHMHEENLQLDLALEKLRPLVRQSAPLQAAPRANPHGTIDHDSGSV